MAINLCRTTPAQRQEGDPIRYKSCNTKRELYRYQCIVLVPWMRLRYGPTCQPLLSEASTSVPILMTGHNKQRITVCLTAMADGIPNSCLLLYSRGKRMPKDVASIPNVIVRVSKNAWMNEELTSEWVEKIWGGAPSRVKQLLVWDLLSAIAHNW